MSRQVNFRNHGDMAFSSDEQQIRDIMEAEIADNIKKGWEEII